MRQVIPESNSLLTKSPKDKTIHELFEEPAAAPPSAAAVLFEDQELRYA